ncbi:hypothetical protein BT96DRAFT_947926 [Gymnopus androsaceus JB14]|uniref:Uncharacterized protein n=1 Tax=Gymnopus androsaceus JB14 TaxID=1447944 RepID=A0A6A4GQT7_9AGAR|nr:hypothetical protein BT96DRAFT_947926 [Gymnopus androsaceus JB14]
MAPNGTHSDADVRLSYRRGYHDQGSTVTLKPNKLPASFGRETITGNDNSKDELSSMPKQGYMLPEPKAERITNAVFYLELHSFSILLRVLNVYAMIPPDSLLESIRIIYIRYPKTK